MRKANSNYSFGTVCVKKLSREVDCLVLELKDRSERSEVLAVVSRSVDPVRTSSLHACTNISLVFRGQRCLFLRHLGLS